MFSKSEKKKIIVKPKAVDDNGEPIKKRGIFSEIALVFKTKSQSTSQVVADANARRQKVQTQKLQNNTWQRRYAQKEVRDTRNISNISLASDSGDMNSNHLEAYKELQKRGQAQRRWKKSEPILYRLISDEQINMMKHMGASTDRMMGWEKSRIGNSIMYGALLLVIKFPLASMSWKTVGLISVGTMIASYFYYNTLLKNNYRRYIFDREMQFAKFSRLLVPYLTIVSDGGSLYRVFEKIVPRLDSEEDRRLLRILMTEMTRDPTSAKPFTTFARAFSGSTFAVVFMRAVNNMAQSGANPTVIMSLNDQADRAMLDKIRSIKDFKIHKFFLYPTYVTMLSMALLAVELGALIVQQFSQFHF